MSSMALQNNFSFYHKRQWHYVLGDSRCGPLPETDFLRLAAEGKISGQTEVWFKGLGRWTPLREVLPVSQLNRALVAACNLEAAHASLPMAQKPSPWPRFLARCLDTLVFMPLMAGTLMLLPGMHQVPDPLFAALLFVLAVLGEALCLSRFAATPAKMLLGIKVLRHNGQRLTFGQAGRRAALAWLMGTGLFVSWAISLAFLWASYRVFKQQNITAWDVDAGHQVIYRPPGFLRKFVATGMSGGLACFLFMLI